MQLRTGLAGKREGMRILIADDDPLTRRLLQKTLEHAGYEVVAVENGRSALECLSRKDGPRLALPAGASRAVRHAAQDRRL